MPAPSHRNDPEFSSQSVSSTDAESFFAQGVQQHLAGNLQGAIACYDQALAIKPDYHEVLFNKGIALSDLGDKPAAIGCYDQALAIKPDDHGALYNKGCALSELGDYPAAIGCYDQALVIKPDYHQALNNKGADLSALGDKLAAIACFDQALIIKPDYYPALDNKGIALSDLGDKLAAIACFDQALAIKPDYHTAWGNWASAICSLSQRNQFYPNLLSIVKESSDWRKKTPHIVGLEEGLAHFQPNTEGWGKLHQDLGDAYYKHASQQADPREYWREAIQSYKIALDTLIGEPFLENRLEILQGIIRACLALRKLNSASNYCEEGSAILRQLLNETPSNSRKRQLGLKFASFNQLAVDLLVQSGQLKAALETAEANKNRCLIWILEGWQEKIICPSYAEMQQLLREDTAIVYWHLSPDALTTFLLLPTESEPQVLDSDRATLLHRHRDFEAWRKDWDKQYQDYHPKKSSAIDKANHPWRKTLGDRLNQLQQILNIPALEQQLSGIPHLILIPHRDLHRFPLHALFSQSFTCTYLPSAQIGLALQTRSTPDLTAASLLSVEDPSGQTEMLYARIESAVIRQLFTKVTPIAAAAATPAAVTATLSQGYDLFHFTGHGEHDDRQPQNSAIGLANETRLTAKEISALPLQTCYLASIAACETAVTNREAIDTEYIGLVSAFLRAGTAHVISTLWNVEEIASSWLMIRFYQLLSAGNAPPLAFQQAQHWFRSVTAAQLADWLRQLSQLPGLDAGIQEYLNQEADRLTADTSPIDTSPIDSSTMNSNHPIYAHPYYWAAFTLTGRAN